MRRPTFGPQRSATVVLVIAIIVAFVVQQVLQKTSSFQIDKYLALSLSGLKQGYVWQLLSFQFLHAGWLHLAGNCITIFLLGRPVEEALGRKSFLTLYFTSGIIGGLCQTLAGILANAVGLHDHALYFSGPVVGASAGAFGLTAAFALLFPDQVLLLFMVIPVPAKYLLWLSIVIAGWGVAVPWKSLLGEHVWLFEEHLAEAGCRTSRQPGTQRRNGIRVATGTPTCSDAESPRNAKPPKRRTRNPRISLSPWISTQRIPTASEWRSTEAKSSRQSERQRQGSRGAFAKDSRSTADGTPTPREEPSCWRRDDFNSTGKSSITIVTRRGPALVWRTPTSSARSFLIGNRS